MTTIPKELLLQLNDIHVHYGGVKALNGATVAVDEGEVVALMGPNGAGKSTILKAIFGLAPIELGKVVWEGQSFTPVSHEVVHRGISFVPQGRRVFRHLTVAENLEIGGWAISAGERKERIENVLELFPALRGKLKAKSGTLSGGQQQMLAIARGLMTDPKILLLDEPSLGLAPKIVKEVFAKIKEINERRKTAIVVVEHNLTSLLEITHRAYVLDKGKVVAQGDPKKIIADGILEKVFLGKPL
ncbi:MAG: ABC transporter ATP-binding protein [Candidatus Taylorbacteria bacterium]|nr:ABC transporter ATP-binding protein [Candidatus Taylorbacteria bacterium]